MDTQGSEGASREELPPSPRPRVGLRVALVFALFAALVGAVTLGVRWSADQRKTSKGPPRTSASQAISPSPIATIPPIPNLEGAGPFLVFYAQGPRDETETFALDVATGQRTRIPVWFPAAAGPFLGASQQVWGRGVPLSIDGAKGVDFAVLQRAGSSVNQPLHIKGRILSYMVSPMGDSLLALISKSDNATKLELDLFSVTGESSRLAEVPTKPPWSDGDYSLTPIVWLPGGGWLAKPTCACDYGTASMGWYRISPTGKLSRESWLGFPGDSPSLSADGGLMSYVVSPVKPCPPNDNVCPDGPTQVFVADLATHKIRSIGRFRNTVDYRPVVMAPDGSRVATSFGASDSIRVIDVRSGRTLATAHYPVSQITALAFIDSSTLIAQGDFGNPVRPRTALLLIRFTGSAATVTKIATGELYFAGWIR